MKKPLPTIAMIASERFPHHNTNTQQVVKNLNGLHHIGMDVELIIPGNAQSFFNRKYDQAEAIAEYYNVSNELKIRVLKTVPTSSLKLEKFFHSLFATIYAVFLKRYDLIYSRNKFAVLIAFFLGKKTMFETYRRLGDESPKLMRWAGRKSKSDKFIGMVLHSNVAAESMLRAGFPEEKLLVLHNGVDSSDMLPILSKIEARQKLNLDINAKYVVYAGNMQKNKCIESLVDIAAYLPDITFLLVGSKPEDIIRLTAYCKAKNVKNVMLVERLPINEVSPYLYAADALIIPPVAAPMEKFGRTVLPFKLFPYLAAGRPIVAPNLADMRELIRHEENGILVNPDDAAQNAEAIRALFLDEKMKEKLAANASETSRSLTWEARAEKFRNWLADKNK
ncbi:MAG: glycosyltransferase [Saprospiraceae bacterium]|nr:glycosyltransferase [Saprospiraceae bacterium]MCF8251721.1 glycosyltransferase [Saprospiraceae bacterium]MCF8281103.1 glycosyltransferase [Bacteroidales bacterium]MCF8311775.1 glycosyltransferase [Saprospiraceae bacterium]MCF8441775.1 glycosyltransferase [Saprospiraceae bacterium]